MSVTAPAAPHRAAVVAAGVATLALVTACLLRTTFGLYVTEGAGMLVALLAAGLALFVMALGDAGTVQRTARLLLPLTVVGFALALLAVMFDITAVAGGGLAGLRDSVARSLVLRSGEYEAALARCFGLSLLAAACTLRARPRPACAALGTGSMVVAGSFLLMGHVRSHHPVALVAVCAFAHVVAVAAWMGGVVGLGAELRRPSYDVQARGRLLATFAGLMTGVLVMLLAGGAGLAVLYLPSAHAVVATAYGQVLLLKLGLVAALLIVSASNHLRLVPLAARGDRAAATLLRVYVTVEQIVLVTVVLVTEVLMRQDPIT